MQFLVTGAAGFIGYHLSRHLLDAGHGVTGFDGLTDYYDVGLKQARLDDLATRAGFRFVRGMLEDQAALDDAAAIATPDVILHLAAQAGVRYSLEAPRAYLDSNLLGSWTVLELARRISPKHLLIASTSSVYGAGEDPPFAESHESSQPLSLYAATKKGMEAMAHSYAHLFGVPTTAFRFFTVYGPWGRPDMALFKFTKAILNGDPIDVYNRGEMTRDFTYVDDLVEAIVRLIDAVPGSDPVAGDSLSPVAPFRTVNIGGGQPVKLTDYIAELERALGVKARQNLLPMQPGDVPTTQASAKLLRALTGSTPSTPISVGIPAFVEWYRSFYRA